MAKVSVLVPVYNVADYLEQCLDSIIDQTFEDIEIICVNDGSTDSSPDILQQYCVKDSRIVVVNKENGGLPSARNAGIDAATGEYLSFVDADDYIEPDMIEKLYSAAKRTKAEIVICGANIFPETPRASDWLYQTLSPKDAYYEECDEELLFENPASRPFVWRIFVSKDLIDRNNLRLNESIHIGEDNAFQFRIYPKAKGIAMISDKLYNYRWYRENSLMNSVVYKNVEKKCVAHIKMVLHVVEEWEKSGDIKTMGKDFLRWSVEFLYDDFIKLPLIVKIENAKLLTNVWTNCGFYGYQYSYPEYIRDMFKYFYTVAKEQPIQCDVSVIISADEDYPYLEKTIKSCLGQSEKNLELIIINNGSGPLSYSIIHKYLHKDKRVRVYNTEKSHYTEGYNIALNLSRGRYLLFVRPNDWLAGSDTLKNWVNQADANDAEITLSLNKEEDSEFYSSTQFTLDQDNYRGDYYLDCSLGNALFSADFVKKNKLEFENYSLESGKVFLSAVCLSAEKAIILNKAMYMSRHIFKYDWIPTEQCVLVLKSFADRLELAKEYDSASLHNKIYSLLISDFYMNTLINNTKPYAMSLRDCPNGENSQSEVWEQLLRILSLLNPELLPVDEEAPILLPSIFGMFAEGRHRFIGDMSDNYLRV
ncbi:MAG: glycosyltransferase family 2 protein [Lachnospiraceae bacterium]|nr:glycosyltransferase family 2 protein [Lachnospiraceae bacterium]